MSNQNELQEIITCLKLTYQSPSKEERQNAEKKLSEFGNINFSALVKILLESIKPESQISKDESLKTAIILYLNREIQKRIFSSTLVDDKDLIKYYLDFMLLTPLSRKAINNLVIALKELINYNKKDSTFLINLSILLGNSLGNLQLSNMNSMLAILKIIMTSESINSINYTSIIENVINISKIIIEGLYNKYQEINYQNNQMEFFEINNLYADLFDLLFISLFNMKKKFKSNKGNIVNAYKIFVPIGIKLMVNENTPSIIIWEEKNDLDTNMNKYKIKIFKYINNVILSFDSIINDQEIIQLHNILIRAILKDLEWIINNKLTYIINMGCLNAKENYKDNKYSHLIAYMLIYLDRILSKDTFRINFKNYEIQLFKDIILPLLIITKKELSDSNNEDSYDDYIIEVTDVIQNNKEISIKSSVGSLLKNLNSKDKMAIFIAKYILILLMNAFGNPMQNDIYSYNDKINVILQNDNEKKIDLGLLVLCIIGECTNEDENIHKGIINDIIIFISKVSNIIFSDKIPIYIKFKIILFIKSYLDDFAKIQPEEFQFLIKYLIENMFTSNQSIISKISAEVLNEILTNKDKKKLIIIFNIIDQYSQNIINYIQTSRVPDFFDILYEITMKIEEKQSVNLGKIIFYNLCKRIETEVERHNRLKIKVTKQNKKRLALNKGDTYNYDLIINKCFNIIKVFSNKKDFVIGNINYILESISPLCKNMKEPKKIKFEEDLILIMTKLINFTQIVPFIGYDFLGYLNKYIKNNKGIQIDSYELLNNIIVYGKNQIETNIELLKNIKNIFHSSLTIENYSKSPFYICHIIQTWLMTSKNIPQNIVIDFIDTSIDKINNLYIKYDNDDDDFETEYFNYGGYIVLIYCGFIYYSQIVIEELKKVNKLSILKSWTEVLLNIDFNSNYEFKILILCLCHIINTNIFNMNSNEFIDLTFKLLIKQRRNESIQLKTIFKNEIDCNFVEEDEEKEDESEDKNELNEKKEIKELISKTINEYKNVDEFKEFSQCIKKYRENNNEKYESFVQSLDDKSREMLLNIMQTCRITVQSDNLQFSIPRKIVKIKK